MIPQRVAERLMTNADRDPAGHLISRYSAGSHGYAQIGWHEGGRRFMALGHRVSWEIHYGPVPDGMTVDHRQGECPQKCIEPTHLRLLSNHDNARRNGGLDFPLGACRRGHPDAMLRTYSRGKGKTTLGCPECRAQYQRDYRARRAARA